ncbi:hypothetical protein [Pseudomonas sp. KNUC1026]|uniref:hypothetical protein n=1 Tax=Pseudomonas sp. KNUC1026 TaxID=2893890 RepID=UPI001F18D023|nr:hypothetical protein [Pseudomonas sp. KNUC1026]UFH48736.1 hypothetical protein LN139_17180 [Pseudomonas sp. KNUC1026]
MISLASGLSPFVWQGVYSALDVLPTLAGEESGALAMAGGVAATWVATRERLPALGWLSIGALLGGVLAHAHANQWLGERLVALGGWLITL